jgi:nucleotide-binding universal stress UspA family protein
MTARILVPLDGSPLSDRMVGQVRRLLVQEGTEVALLHVLSPQAHVPGEANPERAARVHMERVARELREQGARVAVHVLEGDPAAVIVDQALALDAELVAMSSHGRGGVSRMLRGSVAERVLRGCARPVFVATPAALDRAGPEARFQRVLVPLDGSALAEQILPLVSAFARRFQSEVLLLRAEWSISAVSGPYAPDVASLRPLAEVQASLEPARKRLEADGVTARVLAVYGPEATEILDAAEREHVDLVAMSTHGRSGLSRWIYGSVAEHVLRHCHRPLLIRRAVQALAQG